jgi:phosphatidyl-myo-inositol dimannoside synthase
VGSGEDEERLKGLSAELGIANRVVFAGALPDDEIPEAYATSKLYVGPSRMDAGINVEGFGISFIEAAACGVPSVAGDSGGVRSAVRDGETGIVVKPGDPAAAAAAIRSLLRDDDRRRAMGHECRRLVERHYNWVRAAGEARAFASRVAGRTAA